VKQILVEHEIGFELLDLRQQDLFGFLIEPRAEADLARKRPQHRLERRDRALQPAGNGIARGSRAWRRRLGDGKAVLARPCRPHPGIVDMDIGGDVAQPREIARVEIGDPEQAGVPRRHLRGVGLVLQTGVAAVKPGEEARIIGVEDQDAHGVTVSVRTGFAAQRTRAGTGGSCRG
jgi:hypothetical protein